MRFAAFIFIAEYAQVAALALPEHKHHAMLGKQHQANATRVHAREGSVRLLHGSGYLPPNTFLPFWSQYGAEGSVVGMILNGNGGLEQGEASFRSRASQMSTAMEIPVERFVFIPLFGEP